MRLKLIFPPFLHLKTFKFDSMVTPMYTGQNSEVRMAVLRFISGATLIILTQSKLFWAKVSEALRTLRLM